MNAAIFLSGGSGTRTGSDIPKQYTLAGEFMMATYAIRPLIESERIDAVFLVIDPNYRGILTRDIRKAGLDTGKIKGIALPGNNRQLSIYNGLKAVLDNIGDAEDTAVLIHDAARPYLTKELLGRCFEALPGHDGVMPVLPMKDTVYLSEDGKRVSSLLNRQEIFAGQAPELFMLKKYYDANTALLPEKIIKINGASEPAVLAGMDIVMIPGDERNRKVTSPEDLKEFACLVNHGGE